MQEAALRNPMLLVDQDAMHHRNLPGRAAEAQSGDPQPDPESLAETDAMRGIAVGSLDRSCVHLRLHFVGRPVVRLAGGVAAPAIEGVIERDAGLKLLEVVIIHA